MITAFPFAGIGVHSPPDALEDVLPPPSPPPLPGSPSTSTLPPQPADAASVLTRKGAKRCFIVRGRGYTIGRRNASPNASAGASVDDSFSCLLREEQCDN